MTEAVGRRGLLVPILIALLALLILIGLGSWQLERKAWKEALIATMEERLAAAPVSSPPPRDWPRLRPDNAEFLRVKFRAQLVKGQGVFVYVAGSALRDDIKEPGYFAFQPARLAGRCTVVITRCYLPSD